MKNMVPPSLDSKDIYNKIIKRKKNPIHKTCLEDIKEYTFLRYYEYENKKESLETIERSEIVDPVMKAAFISCYNRNKGGYLEESVVKRIIDMQSYQHKNKCPYCLIGQPKTIDHYIPKTSYPEFAIFPPNLIPCCSSCNIKKGENWSTGNDRFFINYYYDILPEEKFLFASLSYDINDIGNSTTIEFNLGNEQYFDSDIFSLIKSHFMRLDLEKEYSRIVDEEISNIYHKIKANLDYPAEFHITNLQMNKSTDKEKYGINYWKVALYESIIESKFIEAIYSENDRVL